MRTALVAAIKRTSSGNLLAELTLGGRSVLAWQIELAQALGCERVVCMCESPSEEVLAQQKWVESDGHEFHVVRGNIQLTGIMRADDDLVLIADGLVPDRGAVLGLMSDQAQLKKGIWTIASGHELAEAFPEDFERIDRDRHWAGLAIMRAGKVQELADLPQDGNATSLLLRLALQARTECLAVSSDSLEEDRWLLATSQAALEERERALITSSAPAAPASAPFQAVADAIVRETAPRWLEKGAEMSAVGAIAMLGIGALLAGLGLGPWGLGVAAIGAFVGQLSGSWARMRSALWSRGASARLERGLSIVTDLLCVAALALTIASTSISLPLISLAILAMVLSQIAGEGHTPNRPPLVTAIWRDRALHMAIFAGAAGFGLLPEALALFALAAAVQLMLRERAY
ncbi:hypothetical protein NAP1_05815 [Erythrobacter sp. NAP1]|uniref:hypothetical protein n=1 Tax=Erythrobacter sp. NAP1 TaxID=237727 RepID=UPI0000686C94|nr:hypothetical protein [Erythrobacter sp. NAP1]EAQ30269.1 hypothetical protein NAP1_05815 [Erythrobacter sp. NAP1]